MEYIVSIQGCSLTRSLVLASFWPGFDPFCTDHSIVFMAIECRLVDSIRGRAASEFESTVSSRIEVESSREERKHRSSENEKKRRRKRQDDPRRSHPTTFNHNINQRLHNTAQLKSGKMADEEEDYMSMVIEEPKQKETFTQKKLRQQREVRLLHPIPAYTYLHTHPTTYIYTSTLHSKSYNRRYGVYNRNKLSAPGRSQSQSPLESRARRARSRPPRCRSDDQHPRPGQQGLPAHGQAWVQAGR